MRFQLLALLLFAACLTPAIAADPKPARAASRPAGANAPRSGTATNASSSAPKAIGKFEDWQAATHQEAGQLVCYAFVKAKGSEPALPGRGAAVLTVTQRGKGRDAVAISAGFAFGPNAEVQVQVDQTKFAFYTSGRSAFARDGKAAVAAFERGRTAVAKASGPRNQAVTDTFSLLGFTAAYQTIGKACPPK